MTIEKLDMGWVLCIKTILRMMTMMELDRGMVFNTMVRWETMLRCLIMVKLVMGMLFNSKGMMEITQK